MIFRHKDMQHLEQLLLACPPGHRRFVITDSLFSMDGRLLTAMQEEENVVVICDGHLTAFKQIYEVSCIM